MVPSGRIFNQYTKSTTSKPNSVESYMESDLMYDIYNTLMCIEEYAFDVQSLYITQKHYAALENNLSILEEGSTDVRNLIKDFFTKLIDKLKDFYSAFITNVKSYTISFTKFLEKNEDKIKSLPDKRIVYEGYTYTVNYNIPKIDIVYSIIEEYNKQIDNIDTLTKNSVDKLMDNINNKFTQEELESKIIGRNLVLKTDTFYNEVYKTFRNNKSEAEDIVVNKIYVVEGLEEYKNIHKLLNDTTKEYNMIRKCLNDMKSTFSKKPAINKRKSTVTFDKVGLSGTYPVKKQYEKYDNIEIYEEYLQYQFKRIKIVSSCIVNTYMQKLSAIKESMKQYEKILRLYINEKDDIGVKDK